MRTLNLGILAHIDAGKTSLSEQLLYTTGAIQAAGSVDQGNTHTDTLAQERQRGITIKSSVASFAIEDLSVNLIDTPGHPDFIAEVDRVLDVLDGIILVVSAVEGVQAQTRILMRAIQRQGLPCLIFVNKIDRRGAQHDSLLRQIAHKLSPSAIAIGEPRDIGTPGAGYHAYDADHIAFRARLTETLAENNDRILAAYLGQSAPPSYQRLRAELARQTRRGQAHPVLFGSAATGAGLPGLLAAIAELLPAAAGDADGPPSGAVFKIERGRGGEKIAYARLFTGSLRLRERLLLGGRQDKIAAIKVFDRGQARVAASVQAGQIALLHGLEAARIGDVFGPARPRTARAFSPPTLETRVSARHPADARRLYAALSQLAEQDPLINLRQDDGLQEVALSLYGEVQKEVIQETLASDYGIAAEFRETTTLCVERPSGVGFALMEAPNPFVATIGLRLEPAPAGSGVEFRLAMHEGMLPPAYFKAVEDGVRAALRNGLYGWEVTDCRVTMTHSIRRRHWGPLTTAAEHRSLAPLVLAEALRLAGSHVCEPIQRFRLEVPADALSAMLSALASLQAQPEPPQQQAGGYLLTGCIRAAKLQQLQGLLPPLTGGEGLLETMFDRYEAVQGPPPKRPRPASGPQPRPVTAASR